MAEKRRFVEWIGHGGVAVLLFWGSLYLAWVSLSAVNFAYPALYEVMDIHENIQTYGPQNRYKRDFAETTVAERHALFGMIVDGINNGGRGLAQIRYHDSAGQPIDTLLREPEVVHLQDVADLLATLRHGSYGALVLLAAGLLVYAKKGYPLPQVRYLAAALGGVVVVATGAVLLYGPVDLFYQWHTLVFPKGHQWFFYYQESLMTTLMKAPDLFGAIAALLVSVAMVYFVLLAVAARRLLVQISA